MARDRGDEGFFSAFPPLTEILGSLDGKSCVLSNTFQAGADFDRSLWRHVRHVLSSAKGHDKKRVWIDGARLGAGGLASCACSMTPGDTMQSWAERELRGREFCIVLNNLESFDDRIAWAAAHYAADYTRSVDHCGALAIGTFSGSYQSSPIGIHQDLNLDRTLHFHFGPGTKHLHTWSAGQVPARAMALPPDDELKAVSTVLEVRSGEIANIETPVLHVGSAPQLCANLCILFRRFSPFDRLEKVAGQLRPPQSSPIASGAHSLPALPQAWLPIPFGDVQAEADRLFRLANLSNGGLAGRPMGGLEVVPRSSSVKTKHTDIFPILLTTSFGKQILLARGQMRYVPEVEGAPSWMQSLAQGLSVAASELLALGSTEEERVNLWEFLQWLGKTGAVALDS